MLSISTRPIRILKKKTKKEGLYHNKPEKGFLKVDIQNVFAGLVFSVFQHQYAHAYHPLGHLKKIT